MADGVYREARAAVHEDRVDSTFQSAKEELASLTAQLEECQMSSERPAVYLSDDDVYPVVFIT